MRTLPPVDPTLQAALAAVIGAIVAGGAVLAWHISDRQQRTIPEYAQPVVPDGVGTVLSVLRSSAVVVDDNDEVLKASAPAYALGLVRGSKLVSADLADVVETDPSLAAQVVSWAASPYYAAPGKIRSVEDAIGRVLLTP